MRPNTKNKGKVKWILMITIMVAQSAEKRKMKKLMNLMVQEGLQVTSDGKGGTRKS